MDEEECRCLYDSLSRARQLPDSARRAAGAISTRAC
jgi:hypothetical protein